MFELFKVDNFVTIGRKLIEIKQLVKQNDSNPPFRNGLLCCVYFYTDGLFYNVSLMCSTWYGNQINNWKVNLKAQHKKPVGNKQKSGFVVTQTNRMNTFSLYTKLQANLWTKYERNQLLRDAASIV